MVSVESYSSANILPVKILKSQGLLNIINNERRIPPFHIQLNPTNRCNLNCSYCSCSNRDKQVELSLKDIKKIMFESWKLGCEAVTITGGGDPLMHPKIGETIDFIHGKNIEIGLVTNGILLEKLGGDILNKIRWIRVSSSDDRGKTGLGNMEYWNMLSMAVQKGLKVDWSFSHVVTRKPNYKLIKKIVHFANIHGFTHVRLVQDLLDLKNTPPMTQIQGVIQYMNIRDDLVIYQDRKPYSSGAEKCWISLLKPVVTADGWIGPCCGWQYAHNPPSRDYDKTMNICRATDIKQFVKEQKPFNGSNCDVCYYQHYNALLGSLMKDVDHKKFV